MDYSAVLNITLIKKDITLLKGVSCIVNSTDQRLRMSTGLSSKIHQKAGSELLKECQKIRYCGLGESRLTPGYQLAPYIIHTVGPYWDGGGFSERDYLYNCYKKSLLLASNNSIQSIVFPSISTGRKKYPIDLAAEVAFRTVLSHQKSPRRLKKVIFCLNDLENFMAYKKVDKMINQELKIWFTPSNLMRFGISI
jgi:O-acetyl-ADP-ribose deacetylase